MASCVFGVFGKQLRKIKWKGPYTNLIQRHIVPTVWEPTVCLSAVWSRGIKTEHSHVNSGQESLVKESHKEFSTSVAVKYADEQDDVSSEIIENISSQLDSDSLGRMFAVIHFAGKQRKVTQEDIVVLDKHIAADVGETIRLNKVMLVGGRDFSLIGRPVLSPDLVKVEATVIEKTLSHGKIIFWYRRRRNRKKLWAIHETRLTYAGFGVLLLPTITAVHQQPLTYLRINTIDINPVQS